MLNLARKWRSKNFDEIVGQELTVRILKNSLYLRQFVPVYLLIGRHGCGKTSTARIFAAAINCLQLETFSKNPQGVIVPCGECVSCKAMAAGNHPDFIEIDAASYTGVDNIRSIVEMSAFLPLMGWKKVYLIDEAHMLSKAAFNAFLKVLEEPPTSALFILATTEQHKIIDTVRSRCLQLFFDALPVSTLVTHLKNVCDKEQIEYEEAGLTIIAQSSGGSVRDALNILERIRLAGSSVTGAVAQSLMGMASDEDVVVLVAAIIDGDARALHTCLRARQYDRAAPALLLKRIVDMFRAMLWYKLGSPFDITFTQTLQEQLKKLADKTSPTLLVNLMDRAYTHEVLLQKTTVQQELFEMLLVKMCLGVAAQASRSDTGTQVRAAEPCRPASEEQKASVRAKTHAEPLVQASAESSSWEKFLRAMESFSEPVVISLFKQGRVVAFSEQEKSIEISLVKDGLFFKDWLEKTRAEWQKHLNDAYGMSLTCTYYFSEDKKSVSARALPEQLAPEQAVPVVPQRAAHANAAHASATHASAALGDKAATLLRFFPGTVSQLSVTNTSVTNTKESHE